MNKCRSCVHRKRDWTNPVNTSTYCANVTCSMFGCNTDDIPRCDGYESADQSSAELIARLDEIIDYGYTSDEILEAVRKMRDREC